MACSFSFPVLGANTGAGIAKRFMIVVFKPKPNLHIAWVVKPQPNRPYHKSLNHKQTYLTGY